MSEQRPVPVTPDDRGSGRRWRERVWSLPVVVSVSLVSVLMGGLGGAALASVGDHQDQQRGGHGFSRSNGPGNGPGNGQGQQPGQRGFGQGPQQPGSNGSAPAAPMPTTGSATP